MNTYWRLWERIELRVATAVALGHHQVPADHGLMEDLVMGLVTELRFWNSYPWADPATVITEHYGEDAAEHLMDFALSDDVSLDAACRAAFVLGRMRRVEARKLLFQRCRESPERRKVYHSFQRGYRNDLFGSTLEGSQELAELTTGHLFHSTRVLHQVLADGFVTANPAAGFEVIFLSDWLPWCLFCTLPRQEDPACWGILCWRASDLLSQQEPLNRQPRFRFFPDDGPSPEYLMPDPPMDLGRLRAVLVPTEATDADRRWIRRYLPGVSVLRSLSQFAHPENLFEELERGTIDFYQLFEMQAGDSRPSHQLEYLGATRQTRPVGRPKNNPKKQQKQSVSSVRKTTVSRIRQKLFSEMSDDWEKSRLIRLLGTFRWPAARQVLIDILRGQRDVANSWGGQAYLDECLLAFGRHGPDADLGLLAEFLTDTQRSTSCRAAAALALGQIGCPEALHILTEFRRKLPASAPMPSVAEPIMHVCGKQDMPDDRQRLLKHLYEQHRDDKATSSLLLPMLVAPEEFAFTVMLDPSYDPAKTNLGWLRQPLGTRDGSVLVAAVIMARQLHEAEPGLSWLSEANPFQLENIGPFFCDVLQKVWDARDLPIAGQQIDAIVSTRVPIEAGNAVQRFCRMLANLAGSSQAKLLSARHDAHRGTESETDTAVGMLAACCRDELDHYVGYNETPLKWHFLLPEDERKGVVFEWFRRIRQGELKECLKRTRPFERAADLSLLLEALVAKCDEIGVAAVMSHLLHHRIDGSPLLANAVAELVARAKKLPVEVKECFVWLEQAKSPPIPGSFFQTLFDRLEESKEEPALRELLLSVLRHTPRPVVSQETDRQLHAFFERACCSRSALVRYQALEILAARTDPLDRDCLANAVRRLAERPSPVMRRDAARTIARAGRRDLAEFLVTLARDPHEVPRIEARRALAALSLKEQACLVMEGLADDGSSAERYAAIVACIRLNLVAAIPRLRQVATADEELRPAAADALAHLGDAEGLLELLNSDGFAAAVDSLEALFELPDQPVRRRELYQQFGARLRTLAGKTHTPATRCAAIHFLGRIGSGREIPLLTRCLYDERDAVRIAAARALARIRPDHVLPYLLDDANFLLRDTAIPRVRILAELRHRPPQRLSAKNNELVRHKLLEVLAKPDASPQEQIEATRALKAEFPFGTLLRAVFDKPAPQCSRTL
jgi:HEAT repeat protein